MAETEQRWGSLTYVDLDAYRLSDGRVMVNLAEPEHRIPEEFVPAAQPAEAVKAERTRILEVARDVLPAAEYNVLVKTLAGWPAPDRSGGRR